MNGDSDQLAVVHGCVVPGVGPTVNSSINVTQCRMCQPRIYLDYGAGRVPTISANPMRESLEVSLSVCGHNIGFSKTYSYDS